MGTYKLKEGTTGVTVDDDWDTRISTVTITPNGAAKAGYYMIAIATGDYRDGLDMTATLANGGTKKAKTNGQTMVAGYCYYVGEVPAE